MSDFTDIEQEAARLLSRPVEEASTWLTSVVETFESSYGSQIASWKQMLNLEYGCWCGPGNRCTEDVDAMDGCCHHHDLAYDSLDLAFDSMWSPAAMVATIDADETLVSCVSASDKPEDSDETKAYRAVLLDVFKARIEIAKSLKSMGL
jgi:Phospholipase A2